MRWRWPELARIIRPQFKRENWGMIELHDHSFRLGCDQFSSLTIQQPDGTQPRTWTGCGTGDGDSKVVGRLSVNIEKLLHELPRICCGPNPGHPDFDAAFPISRDARWLPVIGPPASCAEGTINVSPGKQHAIEDLVV